MMRFSLMKLPYSKDALSPAISAETIEFHHGKHHRGYVDKLNEAVEGTALAELSLEQIIRRTLGKDEQVFNHAAQVWNHDFYWRCMGPGGGGKPGGALGDAIAGSFGDFEKFKEEMSNAAAEHFGSGWAWLVKAGDRLAIEVTHDADTPVAHGREPLLTCDVWEHAYYIDYRNARPEYIDAFWRVVDWRGVASRL
jgi:Fe-Mn family superoxide dismutase